MTYTRKDAQAAFARLATALNKDAEIEIDIPDDDSLWEKYSRFGDAYGVIQRRAVAEAFQRILSPTWRNRIYVYSAEEAFK